MSQLSKVVMHKFNDAKTAINSKLQISAFLSENGISIQSNRKICCPLHDDSTPSFSVDFNQNVWKCFGCPDGGHYIDIWMKLTNKRSGTKYTIYSAVDQILKLNPDICSELGFNTIYQSYDEEFDLFKKEEQKQESVQDVLGKFAASKTSVFSFDEKLKQPAPVHKVGTDTLEKVMHKLRDSDIHTIIEFIADCELGYTDDKLISKYCHGDATISDFISSISTNDDSEIKNSFLEALQDD